jgi:hypothetical protein
MNKEIVPYEEALTLAQIGFVQSCWHTYHDLTWPSNEDKHKLQTVHNLTSYTEPYAHKYINPVLAPTFSQAFRWFRENYGLNYEISYAGKVGEYHAFVKDYIYGNNGNSPSVFTYEEAELECLKKLIEIVKTV